MRLIETQSTRRRGRPRSIEAGNRILDAAIDLLAEKGWEGLTMEGIAVRARVGKTTVYRRWASREEIVIAALERFVEEIRLEDRGSLRADLRLLLLDALRVYRSSRGRLLSSLASAMDRHPELARAIRSRFLEPRRVAVLKVLERARERGELRPGADLDLVHDMMVGPFLYRRLFTGGRLDTPLVDGLIDAVIAAYGTSRRGTEGGKS